ncbi:alpha-tocopherol transfer protein-like [Tribolium castaneum]|uniref:alpha-tocopherol transfer protein-like n=1 Tax=Tribolium castaneum TaxID=7070 RepID=UPI00046BF5C2|nr:PREDICTED: alpha-tocopherol transfer protein-like [Tribolium castaneum]|eukprot:XP_967589.2 PREDICTED: alpha-tocopherol transfer protein-like [Tribolium castaneum]
MHHCKPCFIAALITILMFVAFMVSLGLTTGRAPPKTARMSFDLMDVEKEYAKDNRLSPQDVKILADWMEKQPHLPKATELQLILFLQSCYYRIEVAKNAIDNFFTVRTLCPDIFGAPPIEILKRELTVGSINFLPEQTPEGYRVVLMKLIDTRPEHYHCVSEINFTDLTLMLNLHQQGTCNGLVAIMDMKGLTFGHLTRFNLVAIKKHLFYVQEAVPVRIKGIHHINIVPFTDKIIAMVKPFMKKELIDLLHFHNSMDSLFKFVPKHVLPKDYGGEAPSLETLHEQNAKNLLENMDFFKWMDTLKVDETKRPGKPKNAGSIFGVDGTFKKLEVD